MKVKTSLVALMIGASFTGNTALAGKVYKWVDASGSTHYGEQPPTTGAAETLKTRDTLPSDHDSAVKNLEETKKKIADDAVAREKKKEAAAEKAKGDDDVAKLKENCGKTRANLKLLEEKPRIQEATASGEIKVLTDEERQARLAENKKYLETYCSGDEKGKKGKKEK